MSNIPKQLLIGLRLTLFTAALALVYTFVITGISQVAFNSQANGSLVTVNGKVVGSTLIGQSCPQETIAKDGSLKITINPKYFQGRLSYTYNASTGALDPCNAANSAGSNLGPSNPLLAENTRNAVAAYEAAGVSAPVPIDLGTVDGYGDRAPSAPGPVTVDVPSSCGEAWVKMKPPTAMHSSVRLCSPMPWVLFIRLRRLRL